MNLTAAEIERAAVQHGRSQLRVQAFTDCLARHYVDLYRDDPDTYGMAAARYTPAELARKMTLGLTCGETNKDGEGIRRTCRELGIKHTYKAIRGFFDAV